MAVKLTLVWILVVVGLLGGTLTAYAASAQRSASDVFVLATGEVVGTSTLVRNDNGISMTFKTTGLEGGTVATIWWVIFNNPTECSAPGCGADDVGNSAVDASVFYGAGHVIGQNGKGNYAAHVPVGRLTVDPAPEADQLKRGDGILKNARGAEVHLVLRTHGPAIPGMVDEQIHSFNAGCVGGVRSPGPNTCANIHASIHMPPGP